jgi:hypothetical protein
MATTRRKPPTRGRPVPRAQYEEVEEVEEEAEEAADAGGVKEELKYSDFTGAGQLTEMTVTFGVKVPKSVQYHMESCEASAVVQLDPELPIVDAMGKVTAATRTAQMLAYSAVGIPFELGDNDEVVRIDDAAQPTSGTKSKASGRKPSGSSGGASKRAPAKGRKPSGSAAPKWSAEDYDAAWEHLVENPDEWYDNRESKPTDRSPDFRLKDKDYDEGPNALWLNNAPRWFNEEEPF